MSHLIAPSLLASDFANLQSECEMINNSQADWYHLDVMDGVFVPNISFGIPVIDFMNKHAKKPLDVHLMIVQPERYITHFKNVGANILTVHIEASTHLHRTLQAIKQEGMQSGVALNPHTAVEQLEPSLEETDLVCLMSVNPGFGGQKFIEGTYRKVEKLRSMIDKAGLATKIEIDGGVTSANARKLIDCGADVLVAGSFVFKAENPIETIAELKTI
jgi:ribulose-phosphate 3-epimerase